MKQTRPPLDTAGLSAELDQIEAIRRRFKQIPEKRDLTLALLYGFLKRSVERDFALSESLASLSADLAALEKRQDQMEATLAALGTEAVFMEHHASVPEPPTGE